MRISFQSWDFVNITHPIGNANYMILSANSVEWLKYTASTPAWLNPVLEYVLKVYICVSLKSDADVWQLLCICF